MAEGRGPTGDDAGRVFEPRTFDDGERDEIVTERVVRPGADDVERAAEAALRPRSLDEFVGQRVVRDQLSLVLHAALGRGRAPDHVLLSGPLGKRVEKVIAPAGPDLSDEVMAEHCRRFVKTNYHPASTARMGADGDPMAVLDARMRVRGIDNLRVSDMSAVPNINAGNTTAPAMMLGDRCADFILGLDRPETSRVH